MLSKACEYGIKATVFLAQQSEKEKLANVKEIAKAIQSPEAFTAKVLQQLVQKSIIQSVKGAQGGFFIDKKVLKKITLMQIVAAIDGEDIINNCVLGLSHCSEKKPCPLHHKYKKIKIDITNMLQTSLVSELAVGLTQKLSVLTG
ncbi:MAG TPA: Rrf2 family transcriptional regulator [Chitinophagaceae bacterium]|nr:Rrf2 family transcriptional regulator [Chitinophagaceae bacterium]